MNDILSVPGPALLFKGRQVIQIYLRIAEAQKDRASDLQSYASLNEDLKACISNIVGSSLDEYKSDLLHVKASTRDLRTLMFLILVLGKKRCIMNQFFELRDDEGEFTFSQEKFQFSIEVLATKERLQSLQQQALGEDCRASVLIPIDEVMDVVNISIESDQIGNESFMEMSIADLKTKAGADLIDGLEREE